VDDLQWADGQAQGENGLLADWFFQYREMLDDTHRITSTL
jgi:hypothetical protein